MIFTRQSVAVLTAILWLFCLATPGAADSCPECNMYLMTKVQYKYQNGKRWELFGCMNNHYYWVPTQNTYSQPTYTNPNSCPKCNRYLTQIGTRFTQGGRFVTQYRCGSGHIYER